MIKNNATINEIIFKAESMEYFLNISVAGNNLHIPVDQSEAYSIVNSFRNSTVYSIDMTVDNSTKTIYYGVIVKQGQ